MNFGITFEGFESTEIKTTTISFLYFCSNFIIQGSLIQGGHQVAQI